MSTKTTQTKQTASTQPKSTKPTGVAINKPDVVKTTTTHNTDLPWDVVGSFRLKRSKPPLDARRVGFDMDDNTFKELNLLGIKYGVTFCEVLKGLVDRELMDVNNGSTLTHFIPVLNL